MKNPVTFYLASQNNFGNRGCEALVRSTVGVLRATFGDVAVMVPSLDIPRDQAQWPESQSSNVEFVQAPSMPYLLGKWGAASSRYPALRSLPHLQHSVSGGVLADIRRADVVLSTGGDNFTADYGLANLYFNLGITESAVAAGKPTVLWGASVGPFEPGSIAERRAVTHLRKLTLITVRESHSLEYLKGIGVTDNVLQVLDSAFAMVPQTTDASAWWPADPGDGVLGLNIGGLIDDLRKRAGQPDGVVGDIAAFVRDLLERTRYAVLLVPHVAPLDGGTGKNDEVFNQRLMHTLGGPTPRLSQLPSGLNAAQIKHVISKCRFLIAARTHATIAGFSTAVPTISVAYSTKARGINRDLFGDERYVLETPALSPKTLWAGVQRLQADEDVIRRHYEKMLPTWREQAHAGGKRLAGILRP